MLYLWVSAPGRGLDWMTSEVPSNLSTADFMISLKNHAPSTGLDWMTSLTLSLKDFVILFKNTAPSTGLD